MNKYWKLVLIVGLALAAAEIPRVSQANYWWAVLTVILLLTAAICVAISLFDDWEA